MKKEWRKFHIGARQKSFVIFLRRGYCEAKFDTGESFLFDYEYFDLVRNNMWHLTDGYPRCTKVGFLHQVVMADELKEGYEVDHINRNRTDSRKSNLRVVSRLENMQNKSAYKNNTSGVTGVKWNKHRKKWQVQLTVNSKRMHIGLYEDLEDAKNARIEAEKIHKVI